MKVWVNAQKNFCIEFEESEKEISRLVAIINQGLNNFNSVRAEHPDAFISASLFSAAIGTAILSIVNNAVPTPTADAPLVITAGQLKDQCFKEQTETGKNVETFNEAELKILAEKSLVELL